MAFKKISKKRLVARTPEELLNDLKTRKIKGLIAHQADILRAYYEQHDKDTDISLQLPTGSGKTLVGLLIAEWRRRKYGQRVVYLCPTKQLVNQVVEQAVEKYGLNPLGFIGRQREYKSENKTAYRRAEAVAITNYSSFFCQPTFFDNAQTVILDDVHAGDNYISNAWSLEVNKYEQEHKPVFDSLAGILQDHLQHTDYVRLLNENVNGLGREWVEKIPTPVFSELAPELINVLDEATKDTNLVYPYKRIRDNLDACHMYLSSSRVLIKPCIAPTNTHSPFSDASHRVYMSATLGEGGDLERLAGVPSIARLPVPQGWDKQGIGRRFFLFPELTFDEDESITLTCDISKMAERSLFLLPSKNKADSLKEKLSSHSNFQFFNAQDLENGKDEFIQSDNGIALLANRYDGIDLVDDDCRVLVIVGISRATNLQERFLITRMCAMPMYNDRIITRIVQAAGRCTRSPNDYSIVIIMSDDFAGFLMQKDKTCLFHPELQAEIEFGIQQSRGINEADLLANVEIFLEQGDEWKEADAGILELRNEATQSKLPDVIALKNSVKHEVAYQYSIWNKDYASALDHCRNALSSLGGDNLKGYRAFWNYLAGSAAWLGAQQGITGFDSISQDFYSRAASIAPQIRWLTELKHASPDDSVNNDNSILMSVVERLEVFLENCGTVNNKKFDEKATEIHKRINSSDSKTFELGHELLGTFLGYDAGNCETTAAPDPWWIVNPCFCFVFEDHNPENEENQIGANKVRQAASHPKWVRENLEIKDTACVTPVLISPREKIVKDAIPYAEDVRYWNKDEFVKWAITSIGVVRELRRNFPGRGDLVWRAEACEAYRNNSIAPTELLENILNYKLSNMGTGK